PGHGCWSCQLSGVHPHATPHARGHLRPRNLNDRRWRAPPATPGGGGRVHRPRRRDRLEESAVGRRHRGGGRHRQGLHPRHRRDRRRGRAHRRFRGRSRGHYPAASLATRRAHRTGRGSCSHAATRGHGNQMTNKPTSKPIKFGTDGWRGIIADDYTFENVRAVAQATAEWLKRDKQASKGVVIGFDTRFLSGSFAGLVAEVMAGNGIRTTFTSAFCPTPALSWAVRDRQAGGGVMITASHNPARWNGFKVKPHYGGSAPEEITREIENTIPGVIASDRIQSVPLGEGEAQGLIERIDPRAPYLKTLGGFVDLPKIQEAGWHVLIDPMYGSSQGWLSRLVQGGSTSVREIHAERNPSFPGLRAPEPITANLR